jgi:hypothetical protein
VPNAIELHRRLNAIKPTELPWMYEVSKCSPQEALRNLDRAFINFFEKRGKFPKFKSKKNGIGGFRLTGTIKVEDGHVQLPRLGRLRLKEHEYLPTTAKILSASVSERAGRWFVSIQDWRKMSHKFYKLKKLTLKDKIEILKKAKDRCNRWWTDKLDCRESWRRISIDMSFEDILGKLKGDCHFSIIYRDKPENYLEIAFSTLEKEVDYFLWIILDMKHLNDFIEYIDS